MNKTRSIYNSILIVLVFFLAGCASTPVPRGEITFENVTASAGLIEPLKGMAGHNTAWGDVNGDGYPDLLFGTFTHFFDSVYDVRGHSGGPEPNKIFINQGDGTFKEVVDSPVRVRGKNSGGAFADFDDDGDLDLVLSHQSHLRVWPGDLPRSAIQKNMFFENDGEGNLTNITEQSGLDLGYPFLGRSTFVFDFDGDGLLDLFMQEDFVLGDISGGNSRLMKNVGGLHFKDVTQAAGFPIGFQTGLYGLGGFVDDINGDSWPDVFFAHSCRMFINNQDGTFHEKDYHIVPEDIAAPSTVNMDWTCGANTGDLDNDGDMDFVVGDHFRFDSDAHHLFVFLNEGNDEKGDPVIRDIANEIGLEQPDGRLIHMQLDDADNDGKMDIMTVKCNAFVYRNAGLVNGLPSFDPPVNSGHDCGITYYAGGAFVDYDRDGRIDFLGPEWFPEYASPLLRNVTEGAGNYIDIRLDLKNNPNRNGIGAKVEIFRTGSLGVAEERLGTKIISVANGYSSSYEAIAHFGLPDDKKVDIRVTMPCNGPIFTKTRISRNQMYVFTE
jgi:enediyne biosynthesis protein E4